MLETTEWLTTKDVLQLMGFSRFTLWSRIKAGDIIAYVSPKNRNAHVFRAEDVRILLEPTKEI